MTRTILFGLAAASGVWVLASCSGQLVMPGEPPGCTGEGCACTTISDCGSSYDCIEQRCVAAPCSPWVRHGFCPPDRLCAGGVCRPEGATGGYCQCTLVEACRDGLCVDPETDACSPANLGGLCVVGSVCLNGECREISPSNACSPALPNGYCPPGSACVGGYCLPIEEDPCSPSNPGGRCATGFICNPSSGQCEQPLCSPQHLDGSCSGMGEFCSSAGNCLARGSCDATIDCDPHYVCNPTTKLCQRDLTCSSDTHCLSDERCGVLGRCLQQNACEVLLDCDPPAEKCSTDGHCILEGTCRSPADCVSPEVCSSYTNLCLGPGECGALADCPPGHTCANNACAVSGTLCDANAATAAACPAGNTCCPEGQRCSAAGSCIYDGQCVTAADCPAGWTCNASYQCAPAQSCTEDAQCAPGECSAVGGCIPAGTCATDADCTEPQICNAMWQCGQGGNCGSDQFQATLVKPNMLIVLDRSGSMNTCLSGSTTRTRWTEAVGAVKAVLAANANRIRFGLSTFPQVCAGAAACSALCGSGFCQNTCGTSGNCQAGTVDVAVGESTRAAIEAALDANFPGGNTPTGLTVRNINGNLGGFGLPDPADPVTRGNYVLLVTDGEANCETSPAGRVNGALDLLRTSGVRSYIVGLAFGTVSANLNCNAVYGGTSTCGTAVRTNSCSGTPRSCSCTGSSATACYYSAADEATLTAAFDEIVGSVASCSYSLGTVPPDVMKLYVYLQVPGQPATRTLLVRDDPNGWIYTSVTNQVELRGTACQSVLGGTHEPVVIYGCPSGGG